MPCSKCLNKQSSIPYFIAQRQAAPICPYDTTLVEDWKNKLFCIRDNDLSSELGISKQELNVYLGIVLSAYNMGNDLCFIQSKLDSIQPIIMKIISKELC